MSAQIIQFRSPKAKGVMTDADKQLLIHKLIREIAADLGIDLTSNLSERGKETSQ
jgi:hypothetical protein